MTKPFVCLVSAAAIVVSATIVGRAQSAPASKPLMPVPETVTKAEGKYVTVSSGLSAMSVITGRVTLIVDITPHKAIHLYAPGQEGYLPVAITLEKSTSYQAAPVTYPPAHPVFFPELQQTLKLYDAPFRLTRLLTVRPEAHGSIHVTGTLDYQACDDHVCYRPDAVALRWTVLAK